MTAHGSLEEFLHDIEPYFQGKSLTYVDVGAYVGKVFKKVASSGLKIREAHLVEPNQASLQLLRSATAERRYGNCVLNVYNLALGAEAGVSRMRSAESMTKVVSDNGERLPAGQDNLFDVECRTLDELAAGFTEGHVSLLKIDVEGSEERVLAGARSLLSQQRIDVIYIEVGMNPEGKQQCYYRDVDDSLREHGYRLFKIYEQMHEWIDDSPLLRRVNFAYMSSSFAASHPHKLSTALLEAQKLVTALQAEVADGKARIVEQSQAFAQQSAELVSERQCVIETSRETKLREGQLERAFAAAKRELDALSKERSAEAAGSAKLAGRLEELRERSAELELQLRLITRERDELGARLGSMSVEHQNSLNQLAAERARHEVLAKERDGWLHERSETSARHHALQGELAKRHEEAQSLQASLQGLREERDRWQSELESRASEGAALKLELSAVRTRLEESLRLAECVRAERHEVTRSSTALAKRNEEQQHALRGQVQALTQELTRASEAARRFESSTELAVAKFALVEADAKRDAAEKRYESLRSRHAETEQMAREVHKLYVTLRGRERKARAEAAQACEKAERTRQHLSYRLGAALIENARTPLGWLKTPGALRRAYGDYLVEKGKRPSSFMDRSLDALRLDGGSAVLPLTTEWQSVLVPGGGRGELWAHALSVVAGALATIEVVVEGSDADVRISDVAGEPVTTSQSGIVESRCVKLRAARSQLLFLRESPGHLLIRLRKTRGEPCIVRLEARAAGARATSEVAAKPVVTAATNGKSERIAWGSSLATMLVRPKKPAKSANVLFEAYKRIRDGETQAALDYAIANADPAEQRGISLLRAMLAETDEAAWLLHINDYLRPFGIAPLELSSDGATRFHRLTARTAREIDEGPSISVIMPAFNAVGTLRHAAASILAQTWRRLELIIVDDASQDDTWNVALEIAAADARVKVLQNAANVGPYVSKNFALRVAEGDYITGHDADDWAHPERIESHLAAMQAHGTNTRASLAGMLRITTDGQLTRFAPRGPNTNDGALAAGFISCLFEARFLKEVLGGWDEVRFAGDSEIIQRTERLQGAPIPRFAHLGMICLDAPDGLTNHPEFGYSPLLGMSPPRREYRDNFKRWHDTVTAANAHLPFPQVTRFFPVPQAMAVEPIALRAAVAGHAVTPSGGSSRRVPLRGKDVCDVCIVTDLRLPGGNASSTLEEIRHLRSQGLRVLVVHCPSARTQGKPISSRYDEFRDVCEYFYNVSGIATDVLIVRHPAVACSAKFRALLPRIEAGVAAIIINNSIKRSDGGLVYSADTLVENVAALRSEQARIYPLGPAIRRELQALGQDVTARLADEDWSPTFDSRHFEFRPKSVMSAPFVIGRHARDGGEKWLESRDRLLAAYPESSEFKVSILGGADAALTILGGKPNNWEISPFGSVDPTAYLAKLDAFVYFPHSGLNEAFGRSVMEAIFAGIPCVLPRSFRTTFEDMAFYSEPEDVAGVVRRLSRHPEWRLDFLKQARARARRYETAGLGKRWAALRGDAGTADAGADGVEPLVSLNGTVREYKTWVETGQWTTVPTASLDSEH